MEDIAPFSKFLRKKELLKVYVRYFFISLHYMYKIKGEEMEYKVIAKSGEL